jgi:excisionase family DNA binding protein
MFGISQVALYRHIRRGTIPAYHFGRKVLIDPAELREALRRLAGNSQSTGVGD